LVAVLFGYLYRNHWLRYYGFRRLQVRDARSALWYSPLAAIVGLMYLRGIDPSVTVTRVAVLLLLFCCVGFLEEVLSRGLLYKALAEQGTVARAVVISGVTFGLGRAVNLARGYTATEQTIQIVYGVFLGIVLALLIAVTANIVPLVLFHVFLNISGNLTQANALVEAQLTAVMVVICACYTWWLVRELHRRPESDVIVPAA
jgi:membrane protease YdiL (CAAX protease family)